MGFGRLGGLAVQERLGHSSAGSTLRTYAHLMPCGDDEPDILGKPKDLIPAVWLGISLDDLP